MQKTQTRSDAKFRMKNDKKDFIFGFFLRSLDSFFVFLFCFFGQQQNNNNNKQGIRLASQKRYISYMQTISQKGQPKDKFGKLLSVSVKEQPKPISLTVSCSSFSITFEV